MNLNNWLNDPATNTDTPEQSALLVECDTVPDSAINALAALRKNTYDRIVVIVLDHLDELLEELLGVLEAVPGPSEVPNRPPRAPRVQHKFNTVLLPLFFLIERIPPSLLSVLPGGSIELCPP